MIEASDEIEKIASGEKYTDSDVTNEDRKERYPTSNWQARFRQAVYGN
jgi:hypothetical protein